jgi:hypothetical protein
MAGVLSARDVHSDSEIMGNSMASSVAPLTAVEPPGAVDLGPEPSEQARSFHFAVTWVTLFAHLDPIQATGPSSASGPSTSGGPRTRVEHTAPSLALVPVVASAPLMEQRTTEQFSASWEMVVPKMTRTSARTFLPAESPERKSKKPELV